jgi:hypothetical protein
MAAEASAAWVEACTATGAVGENDNAPGRAGQMPAQGEIGFGGLQRVLLTAQMFGQANDGTVFGGIDRNFQYGATQRLAGKLLAADAGQRLPGLCACSVA